MTNSESINNNGIMAGDIFAVCDDANSGVNKMKFIFQARVPRILPLIQTKHRGERDDFICWKWRVRLYMHVSVKTAAAVYNNNNNNKPICNAPDASVTDPEARRTLRNITVRVDH